MRNQQSFAINALLIALGTVNYLFNILRQYGVTQSGCWVTVKEYDKTFDWELEANYIAQVLAAEKRTLILILSIVQPASLSIVTTESTYLGLT